MFPCFVRAGTVIPYFVRGTVTQDEMYPKRRTVHVPVPRTGGDGYPVLCTGNCHPKGGLNVSGKELCCGLGRAKSIDIEWFSLKLFSVLKVVGDGSSYMVRANRPCRTKYGRIPVRGTG